MGNQAYLYKFLGELFCRLYKHWINSTIWDISDLQTLRRLLVRVVMVMPVHQIRHKLDLPIHNCNNWRHADIRNKVISAALNFNLYVAQVCETSKQTVRAWGEHSGASAWHNLYRSRVAESILGLGALQAAMEGLARSLEVVLLRH